MPARHPGACAASSDSRVSPRSRASAPRTRIANVLLKPSGAQHRSGRCRRTAARTLVEHRARIALDRLLEDGGQRGAAVFDVEIDVAGLNRAVADEGASQIEPPVDRQPRVALDRLRHQLAENHLLGEVLGADDDALGPRPGGEGRCRPARRSTTTAAAAARETTPARRAARSARSTSSRPPSTIIASAATGTAPARITVASTIDSPR